MTIPHGAVLAFALSLTALPAAAQEVVFGLGATDFTTAGEDTGIVDLEYRHTPFIERRVFSAALGANASITGEGDFFVGAGIWSRWQFGNGWFFETSLMPGLYEEGTEANDLGSTLEFRSLVGAGYKFDNGNAVSAAFTHKSNAGIDDDNPGMNTYTIRYHVSF